MYELIYEKCILNILTRLSKSPNYLKILEELRVSQYMSNEELNALQLDRLNRILLHAYSNSEHYSNKYRNLNLSKDVRINLDDLEKVPILEKSEIKTNLSNIVAKNWSNNLYEYRTGGTTGDFLKIYIPNDIMKSYSWAAARRAWEWVGFNLGDKYVRLWGLPVDVEKKLTFKSSIYNFLERKHDLNAFHLGNEACIDHIKEILRVKPKVLLSHATPLSYLSKYVIESNIDITGIKAILTTAEMLLPKEIRRIEKAFNTKVFDYYGNRETNIIAAQCINQDGYHVSAENGIIEVVDENGKKVKEGETGDVLITDFHNYAMPLIRYRIGDMAVATYKKCSCGLSLPLIKKFVGRKLEVIKTKNGNVIPGEFFILLLESFPLIEKAQIVQESLNKIVVNISIEGKPHEIEKETFRLKEHLYKYFKDIEIEIKHQNFSNMQIAGKHRWVVSKIS